MKHTAIGIDLAKHVFQVCVVNIRSQKVIVNRCIKRRDLLDWLRQQERCRVYMEACGGSHDWARQCQALGFEPRMISPQFVVPFRKGHKTDRNDALAIVEAGLRPGMRFVPIKGMEQQDIQSLHRIRERKVKQRTQLINQLHGLLLEYGIRSGRGQKALRETIHGALEDANSSLSFPVRELFAEQLDELALLNERIRLLDRRVAAYAHQHPACRVLQDLPSVGPVGATQLYAALGRGEVFGNGRQAAAYLGVTPRQFSSGGKAVMIGLGFTGHAALRCTLVRGAQSVIKSLGNKTDHQSCWLRNLVQRAGKHKAAVALANKTVRIAWAILRSGQAYCPLEHTMSAA